MIILFYHYSFSDKTLLSDSDFGNIVAVSYLLSGIIFSVSEDGVLTGLLCSGKDFGYRYRTDIKNYYFHIGCDV